MFGPFFGLHVISGTKTLQFSVKTFFFGLGLICLREKNRGRAASPYVENEVKLG